MRRADKEIKSKKEIEWILQEAKILRISFSKDNRPYLVPMNFGYDGNCIYLHSAPEGHKIDILKKNNRVCFEVDVRTQIVGDSKPCNWGMRYYSVIGFGRAHFLDEIKDKRDAINVIMKKYSPESSFKYSSRDLEGVTIIKIEIDKLTGKKSGY
ncbi:MAG: pyridoxamine 5'-phosphate oxidase family protein [Methanobacteriaceae archaeon]|nr:pyridoxamine 5'-phosphate oxidase family protein [Methanobacteriaceae archaeon]